MLNFSTSVCKLEEMFNGNFVYNEHHICNPARGWHLCIPEYVVGHVK